MNTAEYLNTLIDCKEDMKAAIKSKGVTPEGGLSTYADAISEIEWDLRDIEVIYIPNGVNFGDYFYYYSTPAPQMFKNIAFYITDNPNFIFTLEYPYGNNYVKIRDYNVDGKKIKLVKFR
jgi:hypothetical protein